jgi:hypothetical protein
MSNGMLACQRFFLKSPTARQTQLTFHGDECFPRIGSSTKRLQVRRLPRHRNYFRRGGGKFDHGAGEGNRTLVRSLGIAGFVNEINGVFSASFR